MSEKQAFKEPNRLLSLKEISPSLYYDAEMYDCQRKPDGIAFFKHQQVLIKGSAGFQSASNRASSRVLSASDGQLKLGSG